MPGAFAISGWTVPFLLLVLCPVAWADERPLTYDRISLSAVASAEVENDILIAVLYSQREGSDTNKLTNEVNRHIRWAVDRAKQAADITVQTLDYNTNPVYRDGKLSAWRVRQSIRLESNDAAKLSTLIGELQERLAVQSITPDVSPASRRRAEDKLIAEAIRAFSARAALVTGELDRDEYRLVRMDVSTSDSPVRPLPMRSRAMVMEAAAAPPALEPGTRKVQVTVTGTIELQL